MTDDIGECIKLTGETGHALQTIMATDELYAEAERLAVFNTETAWTLANDYEAAPVYDHAPMVRAAAWAAAACSIAKLLALIPSSSRATLLQAKLDMSVAMFETNVRKARATFDPGLWARYEEAKQAAETARIEREKDIRDRKSVMHVIEK